MSAPVRKPVPATTAGRAMVFCDRRFMRAPHRKRGQVERGRGAADDAAPGLSRHSAAGLTRLEEPEGLWRSWACFTFSSFLGFLLLAAGMPSSLPEFFTYSLFKCLTTGSLRSSLHLPLSVLR